MKPLALPWPPDAQLSLRVIWCPGPDYVEPEPSPAVAAIRATLETSIFADEVKPGDDRR